MLRPRDPGLADEVFQDTWQRVVAAGSDWRPDAAFITWLYRIARNRIADHWRARQHRPPAPADADERTLRIEDPDTPELRMDAFQRSRDLQQALDALPDEQREVVLLRLEQELTLEEIGDITGVGRETVKSRLRYAMDKLRAALATDALSRGWRVTRPAPRRARERELAEPWREHATVRPSPAGRGDPRCRPRRRGARRRQRPGSRGTPVLATSKTAVSGVVACCAAAHWLPAVLASRGRVCGRVGFVRFIEALCAGPRGDALPCIPPRALFHAPAESSHPLRRRQAARPRGAAAAAAASQLPERHAAT